MFTCSQYWNSNDIEKHFKTYAQKWRLGNVACDVIRNIFSAINLKTCNDISILVKNENGDVAIDT